MKNHLLITLSDIKGSRQLGLNKSFIFKSLLLFIFTLLLLIIYPVWLNWLNTNLHTSNQALLERQQQLVEQTAVLEQRHQLLSGELAQESADLALNQQQLGLLFKQVNYQGGDVLADSERFRHLSNQIAFRQMVLQILPNGRPVDYDRVTSSYGNRVHPFKKKRYLHRGIDVHSDIGTPVVATANGVVTSLQNTEGGFGRLIKISHGMGFVTYYGHLKSMDVKVNQIVSKGELIGYSGNSGRSTGPHLHYGIRFGERSLDPANFILWTLNNFDQQLEKMKEIPWASLMASMQKLMAIMPLPLSPKIATSTENSILTAACTSTVGCQATSSVLVQSALVSQGTLTAK
jgi:murein DD-endopeptidase MepM/ murein hydrolase activator NlpD